MILKDEIQILTIAKARLGDITVKARQYREIASIFNAIDTVIDSLTVKDKALREKVVMPANYDKNNEADEFK